MVNRLYRDVLKPLGFQRHGNRCSRVDQLVRTVHFYGSHTTVPNILINVQVALIGLPEPVAQYRRDSLWAPLERTSVPRNYPRPGSGDPLPPDLVADLAGPGLDFLMRAGDLGQFIAWAEEVHQGDVRPNWWGRFRPVLPQGTSPLQAGAFAAALSGDFNTRDRLVQRVDDLEGDRDEFRRFHAELAQVSV